MAPRRQDTGLPGRDRPYRVMMIAPTSFFADYGCHVRILEETRYLQSQGHRVLICTYHNGRDLAGIDIKRTMFIPWRRDYEVGSSRHKIAFDILLSVRALKAARHFHPDIIHGHLHEGALIGFHVSRFARAPLVFDFQGSLSSEMVDHGFMRERSPICGLVRRIETFIDHRAPRIITSSANGARLLQRDFGCAADRVLCVPDAVNTTLFQPLPRDDHWVEARRRLGFSPDHIVIVYLGLLAPYQGTDHLIEAAAQVCAQNTRVRFLIAGFPNIERYRDLAIQAGIGDRVVFPGKIPYEKAPALLSLGDIAVGPKLSKTEGAGKLLNYMAMALPTVAFDTPVSHEYLGASGIYARTGDSISLAQELSRLVHMSSEARQALGQALRTRAEQSFSWDNSGRLILQVYDSLLREQSEQRQAAYLKSRSA